MSVSPEAFVDQLCKHLVAAERYAVLGVTVDGQARPHGIAPRDGFAWPVATGIPELLPLAEAFDRVLVRSDGLTVEVLCIQDRLTAPEKRVAATVEELRAVGEQCLRYTGSSLGSRMPVLLRVWEVGAPGDHGHLEALRANPARGKVGVSAAAFGPDAGAVWSNAGPVARLSQAALVRRAVRAVRTGAAGVAEAAVGGVHRRPVLTWAILGVLVAVFLAQLALGEWSGLLEPSLRSLVAFGGLQRGLVLAGQWYRLASAALMHSGLLHLVMNGLALYFGGVLLEGLIGRAWLLALFGLSALGGAAASLLLNPPQVVSVSASGAILGLFGAGLAVSFRLPYGHARTRVQTGMIQVLVPSVLPLLLVRGLGVSGRIDFGAHLGGAVVGFLVGLFLVRSWPRTEARPRHPRLALAAAVASVVYLGGGLALALAHRAGFARAEAMASRLVPDEEIQELPDDPAERDQAAAALRARYPDDPRLLYLAAFAAVRRSDPAQAEALVQQGLAKRDVLATFFPDGKLEAAMRVLLAKLLLHRGADAEARAAIRPACGRVPEEASLDTRWLKSACGE